MRSFFDYMPPWVRNEGSLHVYALPDDRARDRLAEESLRLDGIVGLPRMPEPWLHLTVSRLSQFDDLSHAELTRLAEALGREVEGLGAFDVALGAPAAGTITIASWPVSRRCSSTLRTLVVTPLVVGRKLSLTTAIRITAHARWATWRAGEWRINLCLRA